MSGNKFVFVVCGSREHIDTLHFSLRYLRHFSKNEAIVVTDSSRNEISIEHNQVVDVKTPENFDHHQASIYLKTGLNKFLPKGFRYCYLDTDVIALSPECDEIFSYKKGLVTFASDHCRMPQFSLYAVKCGCYEKNQADISQLKALIEQHDPSAKDNDPIVAEKRKRLILQFEIIKRNRFNYFLIVVRFLATLRKFKLDDDTYYDRWKKVWHDKDGRVLMKPAETLFRNVEKASQWRWNSLKRVWLGPDGQDVFNYGCSHLSDYIYSTFGIKVRNENFQHWNGGVFLFDDLSSDFLEAWFLKTMKIFGLKEWKTRDQGTLIATVWEFGLQNAELLPQKFNLIADWQNPLLMVDQDGNFSTDGFVSKVKPAFVHIYHNFGAKGWQVWDYVESVGRKEGLL